MADLKDFIKNLKGKQDFGMLNKGIIYAKTTKRSKHYRQNGNRKKYNELRCSVDDKKTYLRTRKENGRSKIANKVSFWFLTGRPPFYKKHCITPNCCSGI